MMFGLVKSTDDEEELAANCLWLVTNSKKCPNCSISIQKNEGQILFLRSELLDVSFERVQS